MYRPTPATHIGVSRNHGDKSSRVLFIIMILRVLLLLLLSVEGRTETGGPLKGRF